MGILPIYTRHRKHLDSNPEFIEVVKNSSNYTFKEVILVKSQSDYRKATYALKSVVSKHKKLTGLFFEWLLEHIQKEQGMPRSVIEDMFVDLLELDFEGLLEILKTWTVDEMDLTLNGEYGKKGIYQAISHTDKDTPRSMLWCKLYRGIKMWLKKQGKWDEQIPPKIRATYIE